MAAAKIFYSEDYQNPYRLDLNGPADIVLKEMAEDSQALLAAAFNAAMVFE
jgi:hypothetical protein